MLFRIFSILALVAFCITPSFSVPIHVHNRVANAMQGRISPSGLDKRSMFWGHPHRQDRSRLVYRHLAARDEPSTLLARSLDEGSLQARSFDDITESPLLKRSEDMGAGDIHRRSFWSGIKNTFKKAGNFVKNTASKAVSGVRNVAKGAVNTVKKAANTVKKGVQGAVRTVKKGVQAVGKAAKNTVKWVKKNGATIAKVGFKAVAMATKVASHVVAVIPGVGKAAGKVLSQASKVADFVSSKIPAKLSKGMEKAMGVMEKVEHPLGTGAAGQILDAVLKRDMEEEERLFKRDQLDGDELFERDLPMLEARSFDGEELFERDLPMLEPRSFDDGFELEARWYEEAPELDARSWDFDVDEA